MNSNIEFIACIEYTNPRELLLKGKTTVSNVLTGLKVNERLDGLYCHHDDKSENEGTVTHRLLKKNNQKASALKMRNVNENTKNNACIKAKEFWKQVAFEQPVSKHQKKMAITELGRIQRMRRKKNKANSSSRKAATVFMQANTGCFLEKKASSLEKKSSQKKTLDSEINKKLFIDENYTKTIDESVIALGITRLKCSSTLIDSELEYAVCHLPNIRHLDLSHCDKLTDAGLSHLHNLRFLQDLYLNFCFNPSSPNITNNGLSHLATLPLQKLDLHNFDNATDETIALFIKCPLEYLCINGCHQITDKGLSHLIHFPNLKVLEMHGCKNVTDEGLEVLRNLRHLKDLVLNGCEKISESFQSHFKDKNEVEEFFSLLDKGK